MRGSWLLGDWPPGYRDPARPDRPGPGVPRRGSSRTPPGQYLAGITAESAAPPSRIQAGANGHASSSVIIVSQVNVGVAITVGVLARLRTRMAVLAVTGGYIGSLPRLNVRVRNAGQTFARAHGTISCVADGEHRTFGLVVDTVLPGEDAVLPVNALGVRPGSMPCTVTLRDQAGGTVAWSGTVILPSPAGTADTVRIGKGAYAAPATGVPAWVIALLAIGAAILIALSWLLVLHFRRAHAVSATRHRRSVGNRSVSPP
jgi:hypothetical protein